MFTDFRMLVMPSMVLSVGSGKGSMTSRMPTKDLHSARTRRRLSTTRDISFIIVGVICLGGFFLCLFGIYNETSSARMAYQKLQTISTDEVA